jgi:prophage DNA circulation protein
MSTTGEDEKKPRFDASLPRPYKENWREAYRADAGESPRMASYQAPGGEAISFIQKRFRFFGGQSQDTAEYPFGGLWSNEYINEKPQSLAVEGYLRGPTYIAQRNKLIEALRIPTDDDNPGYIDLPFWGRFPVVVGDNYEVSENTDEQGQCAISIPFTRAGVSITGRLEALSSSGIQLEKAAANLLAAAIDDFKASLAGDKLDNATFMAGFGQIKNTLLSIIGRIQGTKTVLNTITGEVLGISNLINLGIRVPHELAQALFNACAAITGGILEIKTGIAMYGSENNTASDNGSSGSDGSASNTPSLPLPDNEKNVMVYFLSASTYTLSTDTATVSQEATKTAIENLYRTMAFLSSARIIANQDSLTYKKAGGYWRLIEKLEESINRENPAVYAAVRDMRTALSRELSRRELSTEMTRRVSIAVPLLYLAYYLGCDEDKIRELNSIADSFVIEGAVIYV